MKRAIHSNIPAVLLALAALGTTAAANASTGVHVTIAAPAAVAAPVHVHSEPVYVAPRLVQHVRPQPVYEYQPAYGYGPRYRQEHRRRLACRAPAWDPNVRYMPGHAVWRNGTLYRATRLSASVWNVNSPPEWTPGYWVPASCA